MSFFLNIIYFLPILVSFSSFSQTYLNDSLLAKKFQIKADSFSGVSQFDSSIIYFEKASVIYEKYKKTASYLNCINRIAWRFFMKGDWNKSMQIYEQALTIGKTDTNLYVKAICQTANGIGVLYSERGEVDSALYYLRFSVRFKQKFLDPGDLSLAATFNNMGNLLRISGRFDRALYYLNEALKIYLTNPKISYDLSNTYSNIGIIYLGQQDYESALDYYQKALKILNESSGEKFIQTASVLNNMGVVYEQTGRYKQAKEYYSKSLLLRLKILPEDHYDIADSYNNLGVIYERFNLFDSALIYYTRSLIIRKKNFGEWFPDVGLNYLNISTLYLNHKKIDSAMHYSFLGLEVYRHAFSNHHPMVAYCYLELARCQISLKNYYDALHAIRSGISSLIPEYTMENIYANPMLNKILSAPPLLELLELKADILSR
ncbi:MAG: hypothetical protein A3H98_00395 [Bacteroidetes bacterium RIFCSPLOWO2_02_FULL_36_8]|nr:MAG: hypothetical protein A3H98_00395 [Bacteroidetes bacterium RIFCSPLOWO2_02_FULL_36_8]OFY71098.1 MAG: hypothetical protein A3G23_14915 [Bacteroidetes bacterium RIFCSPLOWO2_12_FULL_37_12]